MNRLNDFRIVELRPIILAQVQHIGDFQGIGKAYSTLMNWAAKQGITVTESNKTLTVYTNDINEVGLEYLVQEASMILDKPCKPSGQVRIIDFAPGPCAVRRYELNSFTEFKDVWTEMKSLTDDHELEFSMAGSFEVYQPKRQNKTVVDICIPLKNNNQP